MLPSSKRPSNRRVGLFNPLVLPVWMTPLPAVVDSASSQAMLVAYHRIGMPADPCHFPCAPYMVRYYTYYRFPVRQMRTYDD